jgi:hypothetical protein
LEERILSFWSEFWGKSVKKVSNLSFDTCHLINPTVLASIGGKNEETT